MRCEGNHAPLKGVAANPWLWLLRGDDNGLKMNRFHEELGANPRRSWLNSRNGKISLASNYGPATGWIQGATDTFVPWIGISDPDPISRVSGVNVRSEPTTSATVLTKVWDGQLFVMAGAPVSGPGCSSSWYKIHLHDGIGALYGWVCGQFVN